VERAGGNGAKGWEKKREIAIERLRGKRGDRLCPLARIPAVRARMPVSLSLSRLYTKSNRKFK